MVYQAYGGMNNSASSSGDQNRKIFLGGLSYHTTDDTLRAFCARFGKITDCLVMKNPEGKSRGFGFVTYEDTSSVEEFMRARPHTIDDRQIDPKRAMPREEQNSSEAHLTVKKLFVAGLREGINEEDLRQHFSRYGNVVEALIMKDREGKPRGFAFVTFDDYDAVDKAVLEKPHMVNGRPLDVKKAVPKEKMQEDAGRGASGGGMSSYNRNNASNYSNPNAGPSSSMPPNARHNYGSMRDNFNSGGGGGGSWDNQGGMSRMNNPNNNYNQPSSSVYDQQGGYNSNVSGYNSQMSSSNLYSQSYNPMGQNQAAPVPPPSSLSQQQPQPPMMNYDMYSNASSMSYNSNPNPVPPPNYMQPPVSSYGQSQQQSYGNNPSAYSNVSSPFNLPPPPTSATSSGGYGNLSSSSAPYDSSSSYGITAQNYGGAGSGGNLGGSYNSMPSQQSRGGGPMRGGRGSGGNGNYGGPSNNEGGYGSRPAPYPSRGGRGGRGGGGMGGGSNNYGSRGRGRGH